jgi:tRNA(Ile2) C34 agmatinyltransferase TiaS
MKFSSIDRIVATNPPLCPDCGKVMEHKLIGDDGNMFFYVPYCPCGQNGKDART